MTTHPWKALEDKPTSRRAFLRASGSAMGGTWAALHLPALLALGDLACQAHRFGAAYRVLTPSEAADLDALTALIIPTDDTPGAREAGVVYFIDLSLATIMAEDLEVVREGLEELTRTVQQEGAGTFAALGTEQQATVLRSIEETDFFDTIRGLTLAGMFSHPKYGGNRGKVGWALLGFDDRHVWEPPFGYYDAPEHTGDG